MDELEFSLEFGIGSAIFSLERSKCDSTRDDNWMLHEFVNEIKLLDHYKQMRHILSHFDDTALIPPLLLSVLAFQYEEIDGIICLHVTYVEEGLLTDGLRINFLDNSVFVKDARLYLASQRHKTQPLSLKEILHADFGYTRSVAFFLYTEGQKDKIREFLYPYMREYMQEIGLDWQDWYIAKISDENMEEILHSRVSADLVLSNGTHSNSELLKLFLNRLPIPERVRCGTDTIGRKAF